MDAYIPEDYLCPITQELMRDPVVAADGQSYEREAVTQWLNKGHRTSPLTGESLKYDVVIENHRLKAIIDAFRQNLPELQREQQIKADLDVAIRLREEMFSNNQQTPGQDHSEALKKKDEENKALKENLLRMQIQMEEMKMEIQAKKESVKNPPKVESIPNDKPMMQKMTSDADKKPQEMRAKRDKRTLKKKASDSDWESNSDEESKSQSDSYEEWKSDSDEDWEDLKEEKVRDKTKSKKKAADSDWESDSDEEWEDIKGDMFKSKKMTSDKKK